jgi:hypothetical protein
MSSLPTVPLSSSRDANAPSETSQLSFEDQAVLARAMRELERTSLAIRLSAIIGRQVSAIGSAVRPCEVRPALGRIGALILDFTGVVP